MPSTRSMLVFVLLTLVIFVGLMLAWPWVARPYTGFIAGGAEMLLGGGWGEHGEVKFESPPDAAARGDIQIWAANVETKKATIGDGDARYLAYRPAACAIALALATPLTWRRRLIALASMLLFVHIIVLAQLWLRTAALLASSELDAIRFAPGMNDALAFLERVVSPGLVNMLGAPLLAWILIAVPLWWTAKKQPAEEAAPAPRGRADDQELGRDLRIAMTASDTSKDRRSPAGRRRSRGGKS
ncbi:MAG: hypothetical protein VYC34_01640 [Planctomycetota bacterium]|nr:hypothetical protein [Planctomycetota bacterium]